MPCVFGQLAHFLGLFFCEVFLVLREFLSQPEHQEGGTTPHSHAEAACSNGRHHAVAEEDDERKQYGTGHIVEPEFADVVTQGAFRALGRFVAGDPCQQVAVGEPHAVASAHEGIGVHPGLLRKQGELHD